MADGGSARRKAVAFILSGIFPGLGQFYNGHHAKGAGFLVAGIALSWLMVRAMPTDVSALLAVSGDGSPQLAVMKALVAPTLVLLAIWLWSLIDAWRAAGR
jgi:hypothetical protein